MDMNTAAVVDPCATLPQLPDQRLDGGNILVFADWGHYLHRIVPAGSACAPGLAANAAVTDHLPASSNFVAYGVTVITAAHMNRFRVEVLGDDFRGGVAGNARHLDLNAKILILQPGSPPCTLPAWENPPQ